MQLLLLWLVNFQAECFEERNRVSFDENRKSLINNIAYIFSKKVRMKSTIKVCITYHCF